jgi:TonB family protein
MSCERARLKFLLLSLAAVFLVTSAAANDKAEEQARPLLKAAAQRSLLSGDVGSPYSLAASFSVRLSGAKRVDGKYVSSLTNSGDWAKQLLFADYSDLQVAHGATVWVKRSVTFQPLQAAIVQNAFNSPLHLNEPGDVIDRYFKTSDQHIDLRCVDLLRGRSRRTICVDPDQNLRMITVHSTRTTYEYSDFRPAGKRIAPYRITGTHFGKMVLDLKLDKVALDSETVSQLPAPPEGSIKRTGCLSPTLPILKHSEFPDFPTSGPHVDSVRRLMIYALIGSDGSVKDAVVTQTGGNVFDSSALAAVRRWQYEPAKCGETPVEFEAEVSLNFSMETHEELFGWPR